MDNKKVMKVMIGGSDITVLSYNTIVVGTGAAGFNAADCLYHNGVKNIAMVTEDIHAGTSRNTGSDKQTYYKLSLFGDTNDSVLALAKVLYNGECMDGDHALCEAALSAQCFFKLVQLGVPFPRNRYGEFVGYKTDHDPSRRATSVGPYTSKYMTECLEKSVLKKGIPIHDKLLVIQILKSMDEVKGILCIDLSCEGENPAYVIFLCNNVVYATGGPAGMYADSVYPHGHYGSSGIAFKAGIKGKNLTEWQYGMASLSPRWNISGTYMQAMPRFISTDMDGGDEREFLFDFYVDNEEALSMVFLKGYQWPFDVRKIKNGSSMIDLLVYMESCQKGRRVFLDFRENAKCQEINYEGLAIEAREYLEKAGAIFGTPYDRLYHMNKPAIDFYMERGVNLKEEMLEIAVCAQHNNGGLSIDCWWQTNISGFFAVGEVAGSHGVYRPGGSALNAGQVGSTRAAEYILAKRNKEMISCELNIELQSQVEEVILLGRKIRNHGENNSTVMKLWKNAAVRMSRVGAAIRNHEEIEEAIKEVDGELEHFHEIVRVTSMQELHHGFRLYDTLISQKVYLASILDYIKNGGQSRGSALYTNMEGELPDKKLPGLFTFMLDDKTLSNQIQEVELVERDCHFTWRETRVIPMEEDFFENVWKTYREHKNIY